MRADIKVVGYVSILLTLMVIIVFPVHSQDELMKIESAEIGAHKRPLVIFPHMIHEEAIECMDCHHEYDASGENIGGEGGSCSDCHTRNSGTNSIPLIEAFHLQCKRCHAKEISTSENKNIPQMCGQCHAKKKGKR
jgi:hypothetical protein